jgi:hypothetical protein
MGRRAAAWMTAAVLAISACGTTTSMGGASGSDAPTGPSAVAGASPLPRHAVVVPATLAQATQVWAWSSARRARYELAVRRQCPTCEVDVSQARVTGETVRVEEGSTAGLPTTVEALLAYVDRAQSRSGDVQVVYDRHGVPLWIRIDPHADVADDETVLTAMFTGRREILLPPGDGGWTQEPDALPTGAARGASGWIGPDGRLSVMIGGSGSCPPTPGLVSPVVRSGDTAATMFLVDDTERPGADPGSAEDRLCTTDLETYVFSTTVPVEVTQVPGSSMPVVMFEGGDSRRVISWVTPTWL